MSGRFATGKYALGVCDICGFQYKLSTLKDVVANERSTGLLACKSCWDEDHPQNLQGKYPVHDPEALRNPRPDTGLAASRELTGVYNPGEGEEPL